MKRLYLYLIATIALLATVAFIIWSIRGSADKISPENVSAMEILLENRPDHGPDIGFIPARSDYGRLLAIIQGGTVDPHPLKWQALGRISVLLSNSDSVVWIHLYSTKQGPAAWSIGGKYYRGSDDAEIIRVITDCATRGAPLLR